jgi:hypothetical protein
MQILSVTMWARLFRHPPLKTFTRPALRRPHIAQRPASCQPPQRQRLSANRATVCLAPEQCQALTAKQKPASHYVDFDDRSSEPFYGNLPPTDRLNKVPRVCAIYSLGIAVR